MAGRKTRDDLIVEMLSGVKADTHSLKHDLHELQADMHQLNTTTVKQQVILDDHIRRTEINEEAYKQVTARLEPMEKHLHMWSGAGKLVAIVSTALGVLAGVLKLLVMFNVING